ncbi:hypothetical protein V6N11_038665 [Hibiscus sabdariffa]|uniref:Uncharacterized protein n=1 Tax=Hibiscus sabdariffa TaxID=183260 RepID=A0ABR2SKP4_9ROSI
MDLLCKAYSVSNLPTMNPNPNPNPTLNPYTVTCHHLPFHHSKCPKPEYPFPTLELPKRDEAPLPGRYISKRKRTLSGTVPRANEPNPNHRDPHLIYLLLLGWIKQSIYGDQKKARGLSFHNAAVKDVKWSQQGLFVLSCGYDCSSRLIDVEKGHESKMFRDDQVVGVIKFHPDNSNLFLSGGSKGKLRLLDVGHL